MNECSAYVGLDVHQSFGRKIEQAMEYRDHKHTGLHIVHERDWQAALEAQQ